MKDSHRLERSKNRFIWPIVSFPSWKQVSFVLSHLHPSLTPTRLFSFPYITQPLQRHNADHSVKAFVPLFELTNPLHGVEMNAKEQNTLYICRAPKGSSFNRR